MIENSVEFVQTLSDVCSRSDSEVDVGVLVTHYIEPGQSTAQIHKRLVSFFNETPTSLDSDELLSWFQTQGFANAGQASVSSDHSSLIHLLDDKVGIPITQALLLIGTARSIGLNCYGVNFPGHFLVRLEDALVDPLKFTHVDTQELDPRFDIRTIASPRMIALRMFNNLKALSLRSGDITHALDIVDIQMAVVDDAEGRSSLHFERGEYWLQLGAHAVAREAFLACASECPYPDLAKKALQQAEALVGSGQTLH